MENRFNLEQYLADGVESVIRQTIRATLKNPKQSAFLAKYAASSREATKRRNAAAEGGEHIPAFLIASITSRCNMHCAGCYARANHTCTDGGTDGQLSAEKWLSIFREAQELGVGFILLAGGEPTLRRDVIEAAAAVPEIMFPVFTNGTQIDEGFLELFDRSRNLFPVFSMEGLEHATDKRRGTGTYRHLADIMDRVQARRLMFGVSVTVTAANRKEVTSPEFLNPLAQRGCRIVFYVEYVPAVPGSEALAPNDIDRKALDEKLAELRESYCGMIFLSFPGDEKSAGGCLAAGRGFFHINPRGGAEPCPFSPYSDVSIKETSLREALRSPLFARLRESGMMAENHDGGCALFGRGTEVARLLNR